MKIKSLMTALMLCGAFFATTIQADDAPASTRKPNAQGKRNMRRGGGQMRFDPMMMLAFQVKDELKAYNDDKSDENYKKLEAAVKKVSAEMTEKIREQLKKQLENLDKNQEKVTAEFLQKAKDGELKMPQKNQRKRGGRGGRGGKRPAKN